MAHDLPYRPLCPPLSTLRAVDHDVSRSPRARTPRLVQSAKYKSRARDALDAQPRKTQNFFYFLALLLVPPRSRRSSVVEALSSTLLDPFLSPVGDLFRSRLISVSVEVSRTFQSKVQRKPPIVFKERARVFLRLEILPVQGAAFFTALTFIDDPRFLKETLAFHVVSKCLEVAEKS